MTIGVLGPIRPRGHRDHWHNIRAALRFMHNNPDHATRTRLLYVCHSTSKWFDPMLDEMEHLGLIKYYYEQRPYGQTFRQTIAITKKGKRVLELLDAQAALVPTAPWLMENTEP